MVEELVKSFGIYGLLGFPLVWLATHLVAKPDTEIRVLFLTYTKKPSAKPVTAAAKKTGTLAASPEIASANPTPSSSSAQTPTPTMEIPAVDEAEIDATVVLSQETANKPDEVPIPPPRTPDAQAPAPAPAAYNSSQSGSPIDWSSEKGSELDSEEVGPQPMTQSGPSYTLPAILVLFAVISGVWLYQANDTAAIMSWAGFALAVIFSLSATRIQHH